MQPAARILLLGALVSLSAGGPAVAQEDLNVLPVKIDGVAPSGLVHAALMKEAHAALDKRDAAYEALKTKEEIGAYIGQRLRFFRQQLGAFPERTPLNAKTVSRQKRDGYVLEKVIFESLPGFHVTGLMYLPATPGPYPGVLHACGHSENGKAAEPYQRASILLARNGLAVLCVDPVGQGERKQVFGPDGKAPYRATAEHALEAPGHILLGRNLARTMVWDGMRAIDYLQERPDIDRKRIGCMGNSGGGTQTSYLMALDERVLVAAPNCYLTTFRRLLETLGPQDPEQNIYGQLTAGIDHPDYVLLRAPLPTLFGAATRDFFDIGGTWQNFRQAKRLFTRLGYPERVDLVETDATHGFSKELREATARFMRRWLLAKDDAVFESESPVMTDAEAQVTPEGQVLRLPGARSIFQLNQADEAPLAAERRTLWQTGGKEKALAEVRRLTGIRPLADLPGPEVEKAGTVQRGGTRIEKLILRTDPGVWLPALRFTSAKTTGDPVLYVSGSGKAAVAIPGGPIEALVNSGHPVTAVDLRGLGEMQGQDQRGRPAGTSGKDVLLAFLLGRSYLAMRAEDILVCARHLAAESGGRAPRLIATGEAGPPALHAAALAPSLFSAVSLLGSLASWSSVVRSPVPRNQMPNVVHGALKVYDLPDLVASLPAARIRVEKPVDAAGEPVSASR